MCYNSDTTNNDKDVTMQTRKYPRTLNEAFGPYASGPIHDPKPEPMHPHDIAVLTISIVALVILAVMTLVGWL